MQREYTGPSMATDTPEIAETDGVRGGPKPVLELCERLECAGIAAFVQGEALLDAWLGTQRERGPSRALVCLAEPNRILAALPAAVVTADSARRLTQATAAGPVDLIPVGDRSIEAALESFGLAPLALALRPADGSWCDPGDVRARLAKRQFGLLADRPNPFRLAPRRFWIAAQLIAEYALEPLPELVQAAREALPEVVARLPEGAPVRRVLERILASPFPARALAFLRETGVSPAVLPGLEAAAEARIEALESVHSVRWAAFLRGGSTARALARLRMPQALARRINRVQEAHPLDRTIEGARDAQIRRAMGRLTDDELDGLIAWRRAELASERASSASQLQHGRLTRIETAIARVRSQANESDSLRALALDGGDVMKLLGSGPGRQVGLALAHLARIVADYPERNERTALEAELRAWQTGPSSPAI